MYLFIYMPDLQKMLGSFKPRLGKIWTNPGTGLKKQENVHTVKKKISHINTSHTLNNRQNFNFIFKLYEMRTVTHTNYDTIFQVSLIYVKFKCLRKPIRFNFKKNIF